MTARPLRALVVEDEHLLALNLVDSLGRLGLEVGGVANTRAEALALLASERFDIAFVDLVLDEGYDGLDLARRAAEQAIAVVLVTGQLNETVADTVADLPSAALLTKPYSLEQLATVVAMVGQSLGAARGSG